jgi:hypothetical protein
MQLADIAPIDGFPFEVKIKETSLQLMMTVMKVN